MMKIIRDDYVTHLVINKSEVKEIRFLKDKKMKMSEWYEKTKADCLINGALFNPDGTPIENYISDYIVYSKSDWAVDGVSVTDNIIEFGKPKGRDFISGFPCLVPKININIGNSLSGANPRSVFSINNNEILLTTVDGRQNGRGMVITQLAYYMSMMGVTHSINLDGGGSTRMMFKGEVLNKPTEDRAVSNVIAIWLKDEKKDGDKKVKICLDYGHNNSGWDTGASYYGYKEQDITFSIGKLVKAGLERHGVQIIETRPTKETNLGYNLNSSLNERVKIANSNKVDYCVSIHTNANTNTTANGTETYIIGKGGQAEKLAEKVNTALVKEIGTYNRGVKVQNLAIVRDTNMPAILIECAFLSNQNDCNILINRQQDIANGIIKGVCQHLGIEYKNVDEAPVKQPNKYSYDNTVNALIEKGITDIANMAYWEKCLDGREPLDKDNVRVIFDRLLKEV